MKNWSPSNLLRAHLDRSGESVTAFASRSGVHFTTLYRILRGESEGTVRTAQRIRETIDRSVFAKKRQRHRSEAQQ